VLPELDLRHRDELALLALEGLDLALGVDPRDTNLRGPEKIAIIQPRQLLQKNQQKQRRHLFSPLPPRDPLGYSCAPPLDGAGKRSPTKRHTIYMSIKNKRRENVRWGPRCILGQHNDVVLVFLPSMFSAYLKLDPYELDREALSRSTRVAAEMYTR
jgi:hypothetical protein